MTSLSRTILCLAATAGLALAQGPHRGAGGGTNPGAMQNSNLAMTKLQTVTGPVTAVSIGYGMQYPTITVGQQQIKVAPVWYLLENNFEIKAGDKLVIVAAPSLLASDPYLYAIELTNSANGLKIVLRDANGLPLWSQRGAGPAAMDGQGCTQVQSIATDSGIVEQVASGIGIQMPSLTLKTAAGNLLVIKLGPERTLLGSGLELKAGDSLTVKYAVTSHDGELVALAITKAGVTYTLRDDGGRPAWN
jgi:hypothetical protein